MNNNNSETIFLIDENQPKSLVKVFQKAGYSSFHIKDDPSSENKVISDEQIRRFTIHQPSVVVTGDADFVESHVTRGIPKKVIYVFGLRGKEAITVLFEECINSIILLLKKNDLIEVNKKGAHAPFDQ